MGLIKNKKGGIKMRLPNGFGSVHKLPGNRRNPYRVRITIGWKINNKRDPEFHSESL